MTKKILILVFVCILMMSCTKKEEKNEQKTKDISEMTTAEIVKDMGIGINLGNTFESCGDWIEKDNVTAYETAWGSPVITKNIIQGYADEGFGVLRIPVAWSNMMEKNIKLAMNIWPE